MLPRTSLAVIAYWGSAVVFAAAVFTLLLQFHQQRPVALEFVQAVVQDLPSDPNIQTAAAPGQTVALPHDWKTGETLSSHARYQFDLNLATAPDRLWSIYIPTLEMAPAVFVNGVFLGGHRTLDPDKALPRYWGRPLLYRIPNNLLQPGDNSIEVDVHAQATWGRISEVYIAPFEDLEPSYNARHFWRVTFLQITAASAALLGIFMLCLGLVRRDSTYNWFAGFSFSWSLHNLFFLTVHVPVSNTTWDLMIYFALAVMAYTASIFSFRFLGENKPRWEKFMRWTFASGGSILVVLSFLDSHSTITYGGFVWNLTMLVFGSYPAFLMLRHFSKNRDWQTYLLSLCYLLTLGTGLHDWSVQTGLGDRHNGMLMQFSTAPTLATFGMIMLYRFITALREADQTTKDLERRVEEKAKEIELSFERNRALHNKSMLAEERERIMRDMHDGVGGQLIGMLNQLDRSERKQATLANDMEQALSDLRLMIDSLDDVENDVVVALGLLRNRLQPQLDAAGIRLNWEVDDLPAVLELGPRRVLHFMRILQEAVTNSIKHTNATEISIRTHPLLLIEKTPCIAVVVSDNGHGGAIQDNGGRGVKNMRYRAESAQLKLAFVSDENLRTTVQVGFPVDT